MKDLSFHLCIIRHHPSTPLLFHDGWHHNDGANTCVRCWDVFLYLPTAADYVLLLLKKCIAYYVWEYAFASARSIYVLFVLFVLWIRVRLFFSKKSLLILPSWAACLQIIVCLIPSFGWIIEIIIAYYHCVYSSRFVRLFAHLVRDKETERDLLSAAGNNRVAFVGATIPPNSL